MFPERHYQVKNKINQNYINNILSNILIAKFLSKSLFTQKLIVVNKFISLWYKIYFIYMFQFDFFCLSFNDFFVYKPRRGGLLVRIIEKMKSKSTHAKK